MNSFDIIRGTFSNYVNFDSTTIRRRAICCLVTEANMNDVLFSAELQGGKFVNCRMARTQFCGSDLSDTYFYSCILQRANFAGTMIQFAKFVNCHLEGANFRGCRGTGVIFTNCNLEGILFDWNNSMIVAAILQNRRDHENHKWAIDYIRKHGIVQYLALDDDNDDSLSWVRSVLDFHTRENNYPQSWYSTKGDGNVQRTAQ